MVTFYINGEEAPGIGPLPRPDCLVAIGILLRRGWPLVSGEQMRSGRSDAIPELFYPHLEWRQLVSSLSRRACGRCVRRPKAKLGSPLPSRDPVLARQLCHFLVG